MIVLERVGRRGSGAEDVVAVFGVGLIGRALVERLARLSAERPLGLPLAWTDTERQQKDIRLVGSRISELLARRPAARLSFIWSAGRAGFGATTAETAPELESFRRVLTLGEELAAAFPNRQPLFVHVGSAGGLFEGQRIVVEDSLPGSRRPYGELKLGQEELLRASRACWTARTLRLSSVFGYIRKGQRRGLIPTLVANGLRQRVTSITGRDTTLRDYVWIEDVAGFVERLLVSGERDGSAQTLILASGRPATLMEVRQMVQKVLGRRVYVSYRGAASNEEDITFSPSQLPGDWHPSELGMCIRRVHVDALTRGAVI